MSGQSRLTEMQLAGRRYGRPDIGAMSNAERSAAGLMTRRQAAEHERLATVPEVRLAERVRGPVPDDIWASGPEDCDTGWLWRVVQDAGHLDCLGWHWDGLERRLACLCGADLSDHLPAEAAS